MAISQVGAATTGAYAPTATANKPTGTTSGDYLLALVYSDGNNVAPTAPTGWSVKASVNNASGPFTHYIYAKIAGASEPTSYAWSGNGGNSVAVHVSAWRDSGGTYSTDPFDQSSTAIGTGSATAASITPSVNGCLVIDSAINFAGNAQTPPSGYTELSDADGLEWSFLVQTTATATGSKSTTGGGGAASAILFSVKPAAGGGGTAWNQTVSDSHSGLDLLAKSATKATVDAESALDVLQKAVTHQVSDAFSQLDVLAKMPAKTFVDLFSELDSASASKQAAGTAWQKNVSDAHSALDVIRRSTTKLTADQWSSVDAVTRIWTAHLLITEVFSAVDALSKQVAHRTSDAESSRDSTQTMRGALFTVLDAFSSKDTQQRLVQHVLSDTHSSQDTTLKQVRHVLADTLSQTDRVAAGRALLLTILDAISQQDGVMPTLFTSSGRKTLAMVTSLVASRFGISITLLSPVLGAQVSETSTLGSTSTLLAPSLAASSSTLGKLSATASIL